VIEHVPAGEQQNSDQTDRGPEVAVLDDRQKIRPRHAQERDPAEHSSGSDCILDIVDRTNEWWMWGVGKMA